jgi:putative oxidoreductase
MPMIDIALLIIRIVLGIIFIQHGSQKLFGWFDGPGIEGVTGMMKKFGVAFPNFLAWLVALSEFFGGLLVLVGLVTPLAAAVIVSVMVVAIVLVHAQSGFFNQEKGYEFNLSLIALALPLMLAGAGVFSLDYLLRLAMPLDHLPLWAVVGLVIIPFSGLIITEFLRWMNNTSQQVRAEQQ